MYIEALSCLLCVTNYYKLIITSFHFKRTRLLYNSEASNLIQCCWILDVYLIIYNIWDRFGITERT